MNTYLITQQPKTKKDQPLTISSGLSLLEAIDTLRLRAGPDGSFCSNTLSSRNAAGDIFMAWPDRC